MPLKRFSKLTMHDKVVCKVIDQAQQQYQSIGIMPWHHIVIDEGYAFIYIWDTRRIELVIPDNCLSQSDLTYAVIDNRLDLICEIGETETSSTPAVQQKCLEHKETMPIIFIDGQLTDDERALLDPAHY